MKKIILSAALILSMSQVFASGPGYKVLDEHTEGTPGSGTIHLSEQSGYLKKSLWAAVRTRVPNATGVVNHYEKVVGDHSIQINNYTSKDQLYEYSYTLDCDNAHTSTTRHIVVYAGGSADIEDRSYVTVQESKTGSWTIYGTTKLSGESSGSDSDSGTLYITKTK